MSKKFITLKDVEEQISSGKIYVEEKAFLSSALKDYVRENNIEVVYGKETCTEKPAVSSCGCSKSSDDFSETAKLIEKILKKDYSIQDEQMINKITKIIREVLR